MRKQLEDLGLECTVMKYRSVGWTEFAISKSNMPTIKLDGIALTATESDVVLSVLNAIKTKGE